MLSLDRNGIHAIKTTTPLPNGLLTLRVRAEPLGLNTGFRVALAVPARPKAAKLRFRT